MISTNWGLATGHYGQGATPITARNNAYLSGGILLLGKAEGNYDLNDDLIQPGVLSPSGTGQEKHAVIGFPTFADRATGDYRLTAESKGVDAARRLPDVNDNFTGAAPDMGAFEYGASQPLFPVRRNGMSALPLMTHLQAKPGETSATASIRLIVPTDAGMSWTAYPNAAWIHCEPATGIAGDQPRTISLSADAKSMAVGRYRGAVTFRTNTGYCRTVLVTFGVHALHPFAITFEAEDGSGAGGFVRVADQAASGGAYLQSPAKGHKWTGEGVSFSFDVPADGVYYVQGLTRVPQPLAMNHDSFYVAMDGQPRVAWHLQQLGAPNFHWLPVMSVRGDRRALPFHLTKGRHTLHFYPRETLASLDAVRVSNEPYPPISPSNP